jgi:hypothetical protein
MNLATRSRWCRRRGLRCRRRSDRRWVGMRPVVGRGVDAGGDAFDQEDGCAVEAGGVAGDGDGDHDGAHGP